MSSEQASSASASTSSASTQPPSASREEENAPTVATSVQVISTEDDPLRRRRRRRRRSAQRDAPQKRIHIFLLGIVVLLIVTAVSGFAFPKYFGRVGVYVGTTPKPGEPAPPPAQPNPIKEAVRTMMRTEVLALVGAGVILIYLIPGVEEKVLRKLGIKSERRR